MHADRPPPIIVPRTVRRIGRSGGGWLEGLGPELHELMFDASILLTPNPLPCNGEWCIEYTLSASRVADNLRQARRVAVRQPQCQMRDRTLDAIDACLAYVGLFPRWRADTLALIATDGAEMVQERFARWWAGMVECRPQIEDCIAEIERTGWGLEPEGAYRTHVRVWGRAVHIGANRAMAIIKLVYGQASVPREIVECAIWGIERPRPIRPGTFRSAIARVNAMLVIDGARWGRIRLARTGVRLDLLQPGSAIAAPKAPHG